jgi:hypothetical protein
MRDKRGQFYILAALILITLISGFVVMSNYVSGNEEVSRIYGLGDEIGIEGTEVVDYGIYNGENVNALLEDLIKQYKDFDGDIYFIYGDKKGIDVAAYSDASDEVGAKLEDSETFESAGNPQAFDVEGKKWTYTTSGNIETLKVAVGETDYPFEIKEGQNFYYLLHKEIDGEEIVATG